MGLPRPHLKFITWCISLLGLPWQNTMPCILTQQKFIYHRGSAKSEVKVPPGVVPGEPLSLACDGASSPCPLSVAEREVSGVIPSYEDTCPVGLRPTLLASFNRITSSEALPPSTVTWGGQSFDM